MANPSSISDCGLMVIGAGCGRTGTLSLKHALEILYSKPCYTIFDLYYTHHHHKEKWEEIERHVTQYPGQPVDRGLFDTMFQGSIATVDFLSCAYYEQLMQAYPNAKVILTVREAHSWVKSVRETILAASDVKPQGCVARLVDLFFDGSQYKDFNINLFQRVMGMNTDLTDDNAMAIAFQAHTEAVKRNVPKDILLVYHIEEGWEPLCQFLGLPIPSQPFPNKDNRLDVIQWRKRRHGLIKRTRRLLLGIVCFLCLLALFGIIVSVI